MNNTNSNINRKIFFTDLDGTLLNDKKEITPLTHKAIIDWMNNDNVLVLSSGRPLASIMEVANNNHLIHDNLYIIGFNGSLIYHPIDDKTLVKKVLQPELMKKIAKIASKAGVYSHTYEGDTIVTSGQTEELTFYQKTIHLKARFIDYPDELSSPSCKMLCINLVCINLEDEDKLVRLGNEITSLFPEEVICVKSNAHLLEVFPADSGKGTAVNELCSLLNIPVTNSYAAGDEQNDISMLEAAHTGIAMLNGRDTVKASANVITKTTNNEDGLLPFFTD